MKETLLNKIFKEFRLCEYEDYNHYNQNDQISSIIEHKNKKYPSFIKKNVGIVNEEIFVKNYANPFATVEQETYQIFLEKNDNKLSIKMYYTNRQRIVGTKYFKVKKRFFYFTYNFSTKMFYSGHILNTQNKNKVSKSIQKNTFYSCPFSKLLNHRYITKYLSVPSQDIIDFFIYFMEMIDKKKIDYKSYHSDEILRDLSSRLFEYYLQSRNIKYPNNFESYRQFFVKDKLKKLIKKNDNKLVDGFLQLHGLEGKKLKKILHISDIVDLGFYLPVEKFFGKERTRSDEALILKLLKNQQFFPNLQPNSFTKSELNKCFNIFRNFVVLDEKINLSTFIDHIEFYNFIKNCGETDIKWSCNDFDEFNLEHRSWAKKVSSIKHGTYERIYDENFINWINTIIINNDYFPVLLKNSDEYFGESNIQSNCVKTYIDKPSSLIISLRKGDTQSNERATIEYRLSINEKNALTLKRVQSLGKYNRSLSQDWNDSLLILDQLLLSYLTDNKFELPKIIKKTNSGKIISSEIIWSEEFERFIWENKSLVLHRDINQFYFAPVQRIEI